MFTCITLSSEEMQRNTPPNVVYYNHVRKFSDVCSLHNERLESIKNCKTEYFFFCDYDDPIPDTLIAPKRAIVYGDNHYIEYDVERFDKSSNWTELEHMTNPYLIHKAICNTEQTLKILSVIPRGEYWTELLLYYCLALSGSYEYNNNLKMIWNKKQTGMHKSVGKAINNSVLWLMNNQKMLRLLLNNKGF
jgi:hypothetical protein